MSTHRDACHLQLEGCIHGAGRPQPALGKLDDKVPGRATNTLRHSKGVGERPQQRRAVAARDVIRHEVERVHRGLLQQLPVSCALLEGPTDVS